MLVTLLPTVVLALVPGANAGRVAGKTVTRPAAAQARLAEALGDADSVDWVRADAAGHQIRFGIDRAGEAYEIIATTAAGGEVTTVAIRDLGIGSYQLGPLSWVADAMSDTAAVARLHIGADGHVTMITREHAHYRLVSHRHHHDPGLLAPLGGGA